jgi:hypothetical protein
MSELWNIRYATNAIGEVFGACDAQPGRPYRCIGCGSELLRTGSQFVHVHPSSGYPLICNYSDHNAIALVYQQKLAALPLLKIQTNHRILQLCVKEWRQNKPFKHGKANLYCITISGQRITIDISHPSREYASMNFTSRETDLVFSLDPGHKVFYNPFFTTKPSTNKLLKFLDSNPHFLRPLIQPVRINHQDIYFPSQVVE